VILVLCILGWLASATFSAGTMFACMQCQFPDRPEFNAKRYREDLGTSWVFGLVFGPVGAFMGFFLSGFMEHGWRLR
jgi:hypothetical protein